MMFASNFAFLVGGLGVGFIIGALFTELLTKEEQE